MGVQTLILYLLVLKYRHHWREVELSRKEKLRCKTNSRHSRGKIVTAHFDLQQVLDCPRTPVGDVLYKRLLSCYNFVIVDVTSDEGDKIRAHCYCWDETNGRALLLIGQSVVLILLSKDISDFLAFNKCRKVTKPDLNNNLSPKYLAFCLRNSSFWSFSRDCFLKFR